MTAAQILKLSETDHTPGLHRADTLHRNAKIPLNEAAWLLSLQKGLVAINPFRFKGPGYQEEISA